MSILHTQMCVYLRMCERKRRVFRACSAHTHKSNSCRKLAFYTKIKCLCISICSFFCITLLIHGQPGCWLLLALATPQINSNLVNNCRKSLSSLADQLHLAIVWVPGRRNKDELAKLGTSLNESEAGSVGMALGTMKRELYIHFEQISQSRWNPITSCKRIKHIWPKYDRNIRTKDLLLRSSNNIYMRTYSYSNEALAFWRTGAKNEPDLHISLPQLQSTKEYGNNFHFLYECSALSQIRHKILGTHQVPNLE